MKRKWLCLWLALALALGLTSAGRAEESGLLAQIRQKGEMVVATEGTWAPWTFHDESGQLTGYDVEVARLVAQKLGVQARFVECEWDSIFAGMDARRYDLAANGVEVTAQRAEKYDFSVPYGYIRTALIVRADNDTIHSFEDLRGKRTANSIASTYMTLAEGYGAEAVGVDTLDQTIDMVLSGRADATLNAEVSYYDYLRVHPDAALKVVALTGEASQVALPLRKGPESATLLGPINQAIGELAAEGELRRLSLQFFGSDISGQSAEAASSPENSRLSLRVGGREYTMILEENETAQAFRARLPLTLSMAELNGNEKYAALESALPSAPQAIEQAEAGGLMLYGSDCLVLFYKSFPTSYRYTPIGHLDSPEGLEEALGSGTVEAVFQAQ